MPHPSDPADSSTYKFPCRECESPDVTYNIKNPVYDTENDACTRTHKCNKCGHEWQEQYITKVIKQYVHQNSL